MSRSYFAVDGFYDHFIDYPGDLVPFGAVGLEPPTLESNKWIWDDQTGSWVEATEQQRVFRAIRLEKDEVNKKRDNLISSGVVYNFPDGLGTVQTEERDIRNILGVVLTATILVQQGITDPVIGFRDMEDNMHSLTPTETIQMGLSVNGEISTIWERSWEIKNDLDSCTTIAEIEAVDTDF